MRSIAPIGGTAAVALSLGLVSTAHADVVTVTIENMQADGGFFFTPFWIAAHDGSFDSYDAGAAASAFGGLTPLAEVGDTSALSARFASENPMGRDATVLATGGPDGAPVFAPGESASMMFDVGDASTNRWFSYASMVVPSNDLFVANGDPFAHELFDAGGNFLGPITIEIYGRDVNDAGTEVNSATNDAAFSVLDGQSLPEESIITSLFDLPGSDEYLASFIGTGTPTGIDIESAFDRDTLIGRITIVPAPGVAFAFGLLGLARRRRG